MSQNKYADLTPKMAAEITKSLADYSRDLVFSREEMTGHQLDALKFRRPVPFGAGQRTIPAYELEVIVRAAEVRAIREVMEAIDREPYESDEARFVAFETLREAYTESGKARYIIEHGVPEDTSGPEAQHSARIAALYGAIPLHSRDTLDALAYAVLDPSK